MQSFVLFTMFTYLSSRHVLNKKKNYKYKVVFDVTHLHSIHVLDPKTQKIRSV